MKRISDLPERVQNLIKNTLKKEQHRNEKTHLKSWITNTADMKVLLAALEHDEKEVSLSVGKFILMPRFHHGERTWFVKPERGFVPCGYFTPFKLKSMIAQKEVE